MRISVKYLIPLLVAATITSCSDLFDSSDDGPQLTLNAVQADGNTVVFNGDTLVFNHYGPGYKDTLDTQNLPPFTFETKNNQLTINGYYSAYGGGFIPVGDFKKLGNNIAITVRPPKNIGVVNSGFSGFLYQAFITQLSKGTYRVVIIHERDLIYFKKDRDPEKSWSDTTFNKEIVIK